MSRRKGAAAEDGAMAGAAADWRLQIPHDELRGKQLVYRCYTQFSERWDHDHCIFCWQRFGRNESDLQAGYETAEGKDWICPQCFMVFREQFQWQVIHPE